MTLSPRASRCLAQCMPMKPATPVTSTFTGLLRLRAMQLDQLGVLDAAVHATDADVQQSGHAVEKAEAKDIELEEPHQRREYEVEQPRPPAALVRLPGCER